MAGVNVLICLVFITLSGSTRSENCSKCWGHKYDIHDILITGAAEELLPCCLEGLNITYLDMNRAFYVFNSSFPLQMLMGLLSNRTDGLPTGTLKFQQSNISFIPRDVFYLFKRAWKIQLDGNQVSSLEEEGFKGLPELIQLTLAKNNLKSIPRHAFVDLPKLQKLDLSNNLIQTIDSEAFQRVPILMRLHLDKNSLTTIDFAMFREMKKLSIIQLSHNKLIEIRDDIKYICQATELKLDHNQLTYISPNLKCLGDRNDEKKITLSHNNLTTFTANLTGVFETSQLSITNNPWVCDCRVEWLIDLARMDGVAEETACSRPPNTTMHSVNTSDLPCNLQALDPHVEYGSDDPMLYIALAGSTLGGMAIFSVITSLICLWKSRRRTRRSSDSSSSMGITSVQNSPCGMFINENYRRLSTSKSSYASTSDSENKSVLIVGKVLGSGAFGEVYEGFTSDVEGGKRRVAIKMIKENSSSQAFSDLEQEFKQLTQIDKHPFIIQVHSTGKIDGSFVMVMEMAEYGDLLTYLRKIYVTNEHVINSLDSSETRHYLLHQQPRLFSIMWNVAKGMEYLAHLKILHRDLAARNILLCEGMVAKIADFGLSRDVYESGYYYQDAKGRLPYKWLSPESLLNGKSTLKSDVWSFGILMWEIVTLGSSPYPGIPPVILIDMYRNGYMMPQPSLCPDAIYVIMSRCWDHCVDTRPDFSFAVDLLDAFIQTGPNKQYFSLDEDDADEITVFLEPGD